MRNLVTLWIPSAILFLRMAWSSNALETIILIQPYIDPAGDPGFQSTSWYTAAKEFNESFAGTWGIDVRYASWGEQLSIIRNGDRAGTVADVFLIGNTWTGSLIKDGIIAPISDFLVGWQVERPDGDITTDIARSSFLDYYVNNQWWALPYELDIRVFVYRVDLYQRYLNRTDPPDSWHELLENSLKIQQAAALEEKVYWGYIASYSVDDSRPLQDFAAIYLSWGGSIVDSKYQCALTTTQFTGATKFWTDLFLNSSTKINPEASAVVFGEHGYSDLFADGRVIHMVDGDTWSRAYNQSNTSMVHYECGFDFKNTVFNTSKIHIAYARVPRGPRGRFVFGGGTALAISSRSNRKRAAFEFMKIMLDPSKSHMQNAIRNQHLISPYTSLKYLENPADMSVSGKACNSPYSYPQTFPQSTFYESVCYLISSFSFALSSGVIFLVANVEDRKVIPRMLARIVQGNMTVDQSTAAACSEIDTMVFPEPITIQVYSFIGGIGFAATAVTQILCGVVILAAWKYRSHPSMINPLTSTITLVGCIVFLSSSLSLLGPRSPAACTSIYVLLGTGFSAIIGPIIMRLYGVYKVFISESSGVALPRSRLFAIALLPLLGDMVILILWIVLDPPSVVKQTSKDGARMQVCGLGRRNTDINIHLIVFIAYNWCLLVSAMVLAWKTREVFDPLIERSSHIFFACGNALFLGCVCTLVLFTTDLSPEGNFIFRTLCSIILIVILISVIHGPRLLRVYRSANGKDDSDAFSGELSHHSAGMSFTKSDRDYAHPMAPVTETDLYGVCKHSEAPVVVHIIRNKCLVLHSNIFRKRWVRQSICYIPPLGVVLFESNEDERISAESFAVVGGKLEMVELEMKGRGRQDKDAERHTGGTFKITFPTMATQNRAVKIVRFYNEEAAKVWRDFAGGSGSQRHLKVESSSEASKGGQKEKEREKEGDERSAGNNRRVILSVTKDLEEE